MTLASLGPRPASHLAANLPKLRKEPVLRHLPQPAHPGRAAGAGLVADDPVHRGEVAPAVEGEFIVKRQQRLGELVFDIVGMRLAVDRQPGLAHRGVRPVGLRPVAVERRGVDRMAVAAQRPDHLVIEAGRVERFLHRRPDVFDVAVGGGETPVLVAEDELHVAVHEGQLPGRGRQMVAEFVEALGGDRRQHVPGLLDVIDVTAGPAEHDQRIVMMVVADHGAGVEQLEMQAAEQQFLGLPHDEEAHLVIAIGTRMLQRQQHVDALVVDIGVGVARVVDQRRAAGRFRRFDAAFVRGRADRARPEAGVDLAGIDQLGKDGLVAGHGGLVECRGFMTAPADPNPGGQIAIPWIALRAV